MTAAAIPVVLQQRVSERLLVQVREPPNGFLRELTGTGLSGLMCTGANALAELRLLRRVQYTGARQADPEYYMRAAASPSQTMAVDHEGLFYITAEMRLQAQRDVGADWAITPTLFLRAGDIDSVKVAVKFVNQLSIADVILHAPLDAMWLDGPISSLATALGCSDHPVALTLVGQYDPVAKKGRAAALRGLIEALPGCWLVRVDPLVALYGLAHGVACAAVGVSGGLRHAVGPGKISEAAGYNSPPGIFMRELMSIRNGDTIAAWYANDSSPVCAHPLCGSRPLDSFYATSDDKGAAALHNAHSWVDLAYELLGLPPSVRAAWLHGALEAALLAHDWLPGTNGVRVKPHRLLAALVDLGP